MVHSQVASSWKTAKTTSKVAWARKKWNFGLDAKGKKTKLNSSRATYRWSRRFFAFMIIFISTQLRAIFVDILFEFAGKGIQVRVLCLLLGASSFLVIPWKWNPTYLRIDHFIPYSNFKMKSHVRPFHKCVFRNIKYDRLVDGYVQERSRSCNRKNQSKSIWRSEWDWNSG